MVASNKSFFRNCCEIPEEAVVQQLKRIKGLDDVKLSGGSDLVFYTSKGEKIEKEDVKREESAPASSIKDKDIEEAKRRYLQRKGLL